jgi:hypothetical protein
MERLARPEGTFDLAYTLSASITAVSHKCKWNGNMHVRLKPKPIELQIPKTTYLIEDMRDTMDPMKALEGIRSNADPVVWVEGGELKEIGLGRHQLHPARELVIFTSSMLNDLAAALETVKLRSHPNGLHTCKR